MHATDCSIYEDWQRRLKRLPLSSKSQPASFVMAAEVKGHRLQEWSSMD